MSSNKTCYWPSGSEASDNWIPCNPIADGHSVCCSSDSVCLSNGLCLQQQSFGNRFARGGCTDQDWKDPACTHICDDINPYGFAALYLSGDSSDYGPFCCGGMYDGSKCPYSSHGSDQPIEVSPGYVLFPNTSLTLEEYKAVGVNAPSPTWTVLSFGTTCAPITGSRHAAAIGAGVGVSLGVLLILMGVAFIWQWRRANTLARQINTKEQILQASSPSVRGSSDSDRQGAPSKGAAGV